MCTLVSISQHIVIGAVLTTQSTEPRSCTCLIELTGRCLPPLQVWYAANYAERIGQQPHELSEHDIEGESLASHIVTMRYYFY